MDEQVSQLSREPHIFRVTLSYVAGGGAKLVIVSYDGSIVYVMDADDTWVREFKSGENRIFVEGFYDLLDCNIYLGKRVEDQNW